MSKTIFIPITEEMLVLHPTRTVHDGLSNSPAQIENFINRVCRYIWVNDELSDRYWKIKSYTVSKTEDGTVVLVSYKQAVKAEDFPVPQEAAGKYINTSPLPRCLHTRYK